MSTRQFQRHFCVNVMLALSGRLWLLFSCLVVTKLYVVREPHGLIKSLCRASVTKYVCNT